MRFIADLHVHSKYSIATAKNLDLEHLYMAAQKKGITVVGTGDFTHPEWMAALQEKLIPAEPGLFRLKKWIEKTCDKKVPGLCRQPVRFLLTAEISSIYKKNNKTRKNHNLVFAPNFKTAVKLNAALDRIGNIKSDGRPILGLDARLLLEMILNISPRAMFIPAHIWTPWFSLFGSKSGFDSVRECFEDLTPHIFAVETGLSSDPTMNWRVSDLDTMTLISNSDAHSPMKLGREANIFNTDLSYDAMREALKRGDPQLFHGTLEFFPEEGKYHLDGHKKCGVRLTPEQTIEKKEICPVCSKPVTVGVLSRVEALADQAAGRQTPKALPFQHVLPLTDILAQILNVGPQSKKVNAAYEETVSVLGDEFSILIGHPIDRIEKRTNIPLLGEAVRRMRNETIEVIGGYDGEFGTVRIFKENEKEQLMGQKPLFAGFDGVEKSRPQKPSPKQAAIALKNKKKEPALKASQPRAQKKRTPGAGQEEDKKIRFNKAQQQAICHQTLPLIIVAGPGTGKTMTITGRMVHLIKNKKVPVHQILAVTFTNKAAEEMRIRLEKELSPTKNLPTVATFHAFCLDLLKKRDANHKSPVIIDEIDRDRLLKDAVVLAKERGQEITLTTEKIGRLILSAKQKIQVAQEIVTGRGESIDRQVRAVSFQYQQMLNVLGVYDYEDLIYEAVQYLEGGAPGDKKEAARFLYVFIDEYQDINQGQYRLMRAIVPKEGAGLCVIGDPDQAIYGFRGADVRFFQRFLRDFSKAKKIELYQNYRSAQAIVKVSVQIIRSGQQPKEPSMQRLFSKIYGIKTIGLLACQSEGAEAAAIGRQIVELIGGRGYHDLDFGRGVEEKDSGEYGFGDMAVVYRTGRQGEIVADLFQKMGIPTQMVIRRRRSSHHQIGPLISLLTVLEGSPLYGDLENIRGILKAAPTVKTINTVKKWGFTQQLNPLGALKKAQGVLIDTISRAQHLRLEKMTTQIQKLQKKIKPMTVADKVSALAAHLDIASGDEKELGSLGALNQIVSLAGSFNHRTVDFLSALALESDTDTLNYKAQNVALMTMHAAKGLEFPVVFVAGCEEGLIPYHRAGETSSDMREERRLLYVAMTRAKERLYLTWAKKRHIYGKNTHRKRSPFIREIARTLLDEQQITSHRKKAIYGQMSLFNNEKQDQRPKKGG